MMPLRSCIEFIMITFHVFMSWLWKLFVNLLHHFMDAILTVYCRVVDSQDTVTNGAVVLQNWLTRLTQLLSFFNVLPTLRAVQQATCNRIKSIQWITKTTTFVAPKNSCKEKNCDTLANQSKHHRKLLIHWTADFLRRETETIRESITIKFQLKLSFGGEETS